ncbi:extracellular solute-binding protein [Brevibacillus nitrificans]|uniref:Extracellular solute-binding protein n=1 Tax=Brevibacillus nitrificans TaxID=651560 RepID=A0A3M8D0F2_9BACL|nr:ABC transporter substrate-binding protein [Brevibacillus nitrificans]RNB81358.1 extracellular solute-binding protein [Brevibacillus nitrificans]
MKRVTLRKWTLSLFAAISVVGLAACGSQSAPAPTASTPSTTPAAAPAPAPAATTPKVEGTLSFYTSQPDTDAAALMEGFTKKYPDVKVELFRSGTEEVVSRLQAEAKAGQVKADVLLVADAPTFASLKKQDLLLSYSSPEAADIPADYKDADGAYTGTKVMATVLAVNSNKVKTMPDSWKVLTSPEASGKAIMPSPLYSGAAAYNVGVLTRQADFGWDYMQGLKTNAMTVIKGNGAVLKSVAGGEKDYGMIVDYLVARAKTEGSPVEMVYPSEGVPVITEPIGIMKASQNQEAAKAFVDFVLSEEGQKLAASLGYTPIRKGVAAPAGLKSIEEIKVLSASIDELEAAREEDKKKFGEMMGGK